MAAKKTTEEKNIPINEAQMAAAVKNTGELLAAQPKVRIMIAPDPKEPMWRGAINGYRFEFPKGEMIEVPRDLATLIEQSAHVAHEQRELESKLAKGLEL